MSTVKIAITIDQDLLSRLDRLVKDRRFPNRSQAVQEAIRDKLERLNRSRLAREDTLCRASMPASERRWLAEHRSEAARHWNLLTDWTADALRYAA